MRKSVFVCALILAVSLAVSASAQSNLWDVRWDADQTPEHGAYNWDMGKVTEPNTQCTIVAIDTTNNAMHVNDKAAGTRTFYRQRLDAEYTGGVTIETRMDPVTNTSTMKALLVARIASSRGSVDVYWHYLSGTSAQILVEAGAGLTPVTAVTKGAYHVYRLTEDSTGYNLYIDGALAKSGTVKAYTTEPDDDRLEIGFGASNGGAAKCDFYIDYAYIEMGAYAPGDSAGPVAIDPYILDQPTGQSDVPDQANFTWTTSTDTNSTVYYRVKGTSSWSDKTEDNDPMVSLHDVNVSGMVGGSVYEFYVASSDGVNTVSSGIFEVTVVAQVKIVPGYKFGAKAWFDAGTALYHFRWYATTEADSYLYYRPLGSATWTEVHDATMIPMGSPHEMTLDPAALTPNTTYEWYCKSTNPVWGEGESAVMRFDHSFFMTAGPTAVAFHDADTGTGAVRVEWSTWLSGDEKVYYRMIGEPAYTEVVGTGTGTDHYVTITGLMEPAQYEYYVVTTCLLSGFGTITTDVKSFETWVEPGGNLLTNPGFEAGDLTGWTAFGYSYSVAAPGTGYHDAATHSGNYRLYLGAETQATDGGVYQQVVVPGSGTQTLYAAMWVLTHEISYSEFEIPGYQWWDYWETHVSDFCRIGIDPTGGTDPNSSNVVWSGIIHGNQKGQPYVPVAVRASVTGGSTATVFCLGMSDGTWKQHIVCMDDVWASTASSIAISNVQVTENDPMSVTISWDTDALATSMVQYTWDGSANPNWFAWDPNFRDSGTNQHAVTIDNLFLPDVTQKFRVQSVSGWGVGVSQLSTFKTSPNTDIVNGDFEATGLAYDRDLGFGQASIPWVKFGATTGDSGFAGVCRDGLYFMHDVASYSPTHAMVFEEGFSTADNYGGAYQRVKVTPDQMYMVTAKVNTYAQADQPWIVNNRIGIDPMGGTDPSGTGVIWGPWVNTGRTWDEAICAAIAQSDYITVFLQTAHQWAVGLNLTMFDDVDLLPAIPVTSLQEAKTSRLGWPVELGATGPGVLVTRTESIYEGVAGSIVPYCWVQEDDRSNGMRVRLDKIGDYYLIARGDRLHLKGTTNRQDLRDWHWGEADIDAQLVDILSSYNDDPAPLALNNKAVGGSVVGIQRGPTDASGANNVGLLVKTTGTVTYVGADLRNYYVYPFHIDDGSNLPSYALDPGTYQFVPATGVKVIGDEYTATPTVGQQVAVTGVSSLDVYDPTPFYDELGLPAIPDGSGDEILIPIIRMRDYNDLQTIP